MGRTADYVIDLLDEIVREPAEREKRFEWALGDPSPATGRQARLPFDAVLERLRLIVEVDEDQHRKATPHFDKPDRLTISGVHRGEQRRIYDERKRTAASAAGYEVVRVPWDRKPTPERRDRAADLATLRRHLLQHAPSITHGAPDTGSRTGN